MAQLRTSFVQTCTSNSSIFSCLSSGLSSFGSLFNNDDKEDIKNLNKSDSPLNFKNQFSCLFLKNQRLFLSDIQRQLNSFLNLNINSLSKLQDKSSRDFIRSESFIHCLQLQRQNQEPSNNKLFDSLETLKSVDLQNNMMGLNYSPNSTRLSQEYVRDDQSEVSQVEPYEL